MFLLGFFSSPIPCMILLFLYLWGYAFYQINIHAPASESNTKPETAQIIAYPADDNTYNDRESFSSSGLGKIISDCSILSAPKACFKAADALWLGGKPFKLLAFSLFAKPPPVTAC